MVRVTHDTVLQRLAAALAQGSSSERDWSGTSLAFWNVGTCLEFLVRGAFQLGRPRLGPDNGIDDIDVSEVLRRKARVWRITGAANLFYGQREPLRAFVELGAAADEVIRYRLFYGHTDPKLRRRWGIGLPLPEEWRCSFEWRR